MKEINWVGDKGQNNRAQQKIPGLKVRGNVPCEGMSHRLRFQGLYVVEECIILQAVKKSLENLQVEPIYCNTALFFSDELDD